jgi:hypothetical protein
MNANRIPASPSRLAACAGRALGAATFAALALAACGGGNGSDSTTVAGNTPVVYAKRVNTAGLDPLTGSSFVAGGDLMIREVASPSAPEYNITAPITQGVGDVTDPEVSYDGTKIVFAMNCPASNTSTIGGVPACTGRWNIWEYDMSGGSLTNGSLRRITDTTSNDDVGPAYLPAGAGYVFSSNRQTLSYANQFLGHSYYALDEYERQQVFNLHTMDINGNSITQISFDQSHERNPVVRPDGTIMFSRWEHVADRNRFTVFKVNPDGTNLFVLYGAHADGNSFLHPRDMDPSGPYAGFVSSDLMSLDRTHGGGALMLIDAAHYADQNNPVSPSVPASGGQVQATSQQLNFGMGPSMYGRVTTPYPLWDGTNRFLVSFAPCEVSNAGVVVSCSTLSSAEFSALSDTNRLLTSIAQDPIQDNVPPSYAVYMFDPSAQTWTLVAAPPAGFMYTDPIPIMARTEPSAYQPSPLSRNATLAAAHLAELTVASVYDTDLLGRMGQQMLAQADVPAGCTTATTASALTAAQSAMIPQTTAPANDTRPSVADIKALRNPGNAAYNCSPLRFIRAIRAVAPPTGATGERAAIGDTNFEQTQILGYAPIEPDGSFQLIIPADTPFAFSITDSQGRSFQVHTNWIQARAGEVRSCDGCHSPRRGGALNSGTLTNAFGTSNPAPTWNPALLAVRQPGDTMALTHGNYVQSLNPTTVTLQNNPVFQLNVNGTAAGSGLQFTDVWAQGTAITPRPSISLNYSQLTTAAPTNGVINYPDHIQPIWDAARTGGACSSCHSAADTHLTLMSTKGGTGRMDSYESLMVGPPQLDAQGNPVLIVEDGVQVVATAPALVYSSASEGQAVGLARQSRLIEILTGQTFMSSSAAQTLYPTPSVNHVGMLNPSELLLVTEWVDTGGKYYNDPFNANSQVQLVTSLSQSVFASTVHPILMANCAANCHLAKGSGGTTPPGGSFAGDKFVLTGDVMGTTSGTPSGDYGNVLSLIGNVCTAADPTNYILSVPSHAPHPTGSTLPAPLPLNGANYNAIAAWILSGC